MNENGAQTGSLQTASLSMNASKLSTLHLQGRKKIHMIVEAKHAFTINTIVAFVFGIGLLLVPATIGAIYGIENSASSDLMARYFGLTLIGIGLLTWLFRSITDMAAVKAVILALLISDVLGIIVSLYAVLSGTMNQIGWSAVIIYVLLVIDYAYFYFKK